MTTLVTGAAGFIGHHCVRALLDRDDEVLGVDDLNDYYDVDLKRARLERLRDRSGFTFRELDVADEDALRSALAGRRLRRILHLAAQPGVRYSLEAPLRYVHANVTGHVALLELARSLDGLEHFAHASSSSVYGANDDIPFSVAARVDRPVSLYAATKRSGELISHCYAHLHGLPITALRYFTVYGPWYRPDMALWLFTRAILAGQPIRLFNEGDMRRDFTYVDDVVAGTLAALDHPPPAGNGPPLRTYNVGRGKAERLGRLVEVLEEALGLQAEKVLEPMQPGDVKETFADIELTRRDLGYEPATDIEVGVPRFVEWYREYHGV